MKLFFDEAQRLHDPDSFIVLGQVKPNPETPERAARLLAGVAETGHEAITPEDHGLGPIAAVHTPDYLHFLKTIHEEWSLVPGAGPEVIPNIHPTRHRPDALYTSPVGKAGYFMADTACPISADTWGSVYASAQSAIGAALAVREGEAAVAYALCRPPGHHAFADMAGGFCFVNNSAVAAQLLRARHDRVCVLDVDVHHGNGTQGIFYERSDVLTVSLHRDPAGYYPFFWGHAHELGEGAGRGYNLNYPLSKGTIDHGFLMTLDQALEKIRLYAPGALVVALGLDAYEGDPLKGLKITTEGFGYIAARIARLGLPTVLIQEGGYVSDGLGPNLASFLAGFESI
ncbi:MAG: histone deacetylase family protein [Alphaproteobacteria bacterium]|nr:histone deacetylase family protein [Alphaproteobacteria bacterium]